MLYEVITRIMTGFDNVPEGRWREDVERHYVEAPTGVKINYDPGQQQPGDLRAALTQVEPEYDQDD